MYRKKHCIISLSEVVKFLTKWADELETRKYKYVVGYAIGFPRKDDAISISIPYTVNKTVNYFDIDHEEGDDCNE